MTLSQQALARLQEGNRRFVSGSWDRTMLANETRRAQLVAGQNPFAIILGCSDSRVPAEIVFGQGLGDLFVIRVAGNIAAASQIGSVEFAVEQFATSLVVVLGHSQCGAVIATIDQLSRPLECRSQNLQAIVGRVQPAVESLLSTEPEHDPDTLLTLAIRANVRAVAAEVRRGSEALALRIDRGELLVVGAEYSLATGVVDFFDGVD